MRVSRGALFAACLLVALAAPAVAHHVGIDRSEPSAGARLNEPPTQVQVWFDQPVAFPGSDLVVTDQADRRVDAGATRRGDDGARHLVAALGRVAPGIYTVIWRTTAEADGEYNEGRFTFTVDSRGPPSAALGIVGLVAVLLALFRINLARQD